MSAENNFSQPRNRKKNSFLTFGVLGFVSVFTTVALLAVFLIYFLSKQMNDAVWLTVLLFVAYLCVTAGIFAVVYLSRKNKYFRFLDKFGFGETDDFPLGIIARLSQAAAVCTPEGNLVWMNKKFASRSQKHILISDNLSITSILDFRQSDFVGLNKTADEAPSDLTPKQLFQFLVDNSCGVTTKGFNFFGGEFTLYAYPLYSNKNFYFVLVLTDDTEKNSWIRKYNNNLTQIIYIAVDNLNELAQSEQESYRIASNQVAAIIKSWANEYGAFLKEYEREKYVAVFTHMSVEQLEKKRFDLLEQVSKIRIGSENLSVTVSAGVSPETGSLDDKDKSAQAALEMALQRGGNQAVIMGETPKFFGAKAITSLKRSGVRHRVFADKLMYRMRACSNVIIMGHRNPDFDALGSCVGLARLALSIDKPTNIIMNTEDSNLYDCFEKLSVIPEYEGMFVNAIEAQEMLTSDTLVICSDVNNPDNFEAFNVAKNADYLFIIDHHRQSEKTPEAVPGQCETLIVPSASSACELVSEILELELPENTRLHHEEADIMFAGILLDTKSFTRNALVPTFGAAIYLRNNGADPNKAQALFKIDLDGFRSESAFSTDLEIYHDFIVIAKETGSESSPAKRITAAKTADRLLNIKKIRGSFVVAKMLNDVFISARSDGSVNVQLIMEALKGGGHYNAAATMLKEISVEEAVEKLKEAITQYFGTEDSVVPMPKKRKKRMVLRQKK